MRSIFVLGDSISIQYGPFLKEMLAGRFEYDRKRGEEQALVDLNNPVGANGGDSSMVLDYLRTECNRGVRYDILLFNCGLHDIKTDPLSGTRQVPEDAYRDNLQRIAGLAREMARDSLWIRTTDAVEEVHNTRNMSFQRYHGDVERYNAIADEVFADTGIPLIDLYSFTRVFGNAAYCDHVHFTEEVRRLQAAYITGQLEARFA